MQKYSCPICRGQNIKMSRIVSSVYSDKFYELGSCLDCSHIFVLNPPTACELDKIYATVYNYASHLAIEDEKRWRFRRLKGCIREAIPSDTRIIDIGCGQGNDLEVLRESGYSNLFGIEMDGVSIEKCKEKGLDVFEGTFSQWIHSPLSKFNGGRTCILLSNVIEHITNVGYFFEEINSFLKSGDYLIIMVPNARALSAILLGRYWGIWLVPVHPHHFSKTSLRSLLLSKGFAVQAAFTRGADSLFFLLTLCSMLGIKSRSQTNPAWQQVIIKMTSLIFRCWVFIGDEELIVIAKKK
jgi:2-polyprenyl-3-methyl-5-hydroxy-6-metoxy-1,4-benzoquinol methylase